MNDRTNAHLPAGWIWSRFDEIGSVSLGRQRSPANHSGPAMRPYVRAANITWTGLDLTDVKEMNFEEADFARFRLQPGDVLINEGSGSAAEVGKPAIWRGEIADCCFQNTILRVQPKFCSSEYVFNYIKLCAKSGHFVSSTQGVNIFHIGREGLARQVIPVPPAPEQRRIVAKIDSLSAKSKRARDHLDHIPCLVEKYRQAVLEAATDGRLTKSWASSSGLDGSWRKVSWSDAGETLNGRAFPSSEYASEGVKLLRPGNLAANGKLVWTDKNTRFLPRAFVKDFQRHYIHGAAILINLTAQSLDDQFLGRACISGAGDEFFLNQRIALFRPKCMTERFCLYVLKSPSFRQFVDGGLNAGSLIQHVHTKQLERFVFPVPCRLEQEEIVLRIETAFAWIDRLASEAANAYKLIDRLDQAVLAKAFRGELVPQDPADKLASALLERVRAARVGTAPTGRGRGRPRQVAPH